MDSKEKKEQSDIDYYDLVIDTESFENLGKIQIEILDSNDKVVKSKEIKCKGWDVRSNEENWKKYLQKKDQKSIVVGVIGNANRGKSFLLQQLANENFPSGYAVGTKGLSIKYPKNKDRNITLLDTAGIETPIKKIEDYIIDQNNITENDIRQTFSKIARDKQILEVFFQTFSIMHSDIIMVVVNQLTRLEQNIISRVIQEKKEKRIFIIHNLSTFVQIKQVEDYIESILKKSLTFKVEEERIPDYGESSELRNRKYFYQTSLSKQDVEAKNRGFVEEGEIPIHLILANHDSEAGKYYNGTTIEYLRAQIVTGQSHARKFPIIERIVEFISAFSDRITEEKLKPEDIIYDENEKKIRLKDPNHVLKLKKCLIDEIGLETFMSSSFKPKYRYYRKKNEFIIEFQICGKISSINYEIHERERDYDFIFKGTKEMKIEKTDFYQNTRKDGDFVVAFSMPRRILPIEIKKHKYCQKTRSLFKIAFSVKEKTYESLKGKAIF